MNYIDLLNTPFKYGGRQVAQDGGLDCYGVVVEMSRRCGISMPERQFSESHQINSALMACQMDQWERCKPAATAVVLIKILNINCHVGFLLNEFEFIHAWERSNGVVVEQLEDWHKRIEGFYRYVGN